MLQTICAPKRKWAVTHFLKEMMVQERFGIPCSHAGDKADSAARRVLRSVAAYSHVSRGITAPTPLPLPQLHRESGTHPVPLQYVDREIAYGLCHLVNRGIIPRHSNLTNALTGRDNVLHAEAAHLRPHRERFERPAVVATVAEVAAELPYRCSMPSSICMSHLLLLYRGQ